MAATATAERTTRMDTSKAFDCPVCHAGTRQPGTTTITITRDDGVFVFRHVPAAICDNCADAVVDETIGRALERQQAAIRAAGATTALCEFVPA
jgi:YgiT-type zinc finger domain-containing protein